MSGSTSGRIAARALLAGALLSPMAAAATAAPAELNGPGLNQNRAALGSIQAVRGEQCQIDYTATVVTAHGTGSDSFEIQVIDDGATIQIVPLSAPADGASHQFHGQIQLHGPVFERAPGVGLYLMDDGQVLDALDPFGIDCSVLEVPALAGRGYLALGALLALAAVVALRRLRAA